MRWIAVYGCTLCIDHSDFILYQMGQENVLLCDCVTGNKFVKSAAIYASKMRYPPTIKFSAVSNGCWLLVP